MEPNWSGVLEASSSTTLRDVMRAVDSGSAGTAVVVDETGRLLGVVTDGDCRRHLLAGGSLEDSLGPVLNTDPLTVTEDANRASVLDLMQAYEIAVLPIVDSTKGLVGVHLFRRIIGKQRRDNLCVLIAGGRGTRLGPVTSTTPKPMIRVAGRPILERLILHFMSFGITRFVISVGHLGAIIEEYFGNGDQLGCSITYVRDPDDRPLGTAGALTLLEEQDFPSELPLVVANGDLLTQVDVGAMLALHNQFQAKATIGVHRYSHQVPFGVVHSDGLGGVTAIEEKPDHHWQVSAGIYVIDANVLGRLPRHATLSMTDLLQDLVADGERVSVFEVDEEWMDVGTPRDLQRARGR